jgi:hypothetical protein
VVFRRGRLIATLSALALIFSASIALGGVGTGSSPAAQQDPEDWTEHRVVIFDVAADIIGANSIPHGVLGRVISCSRRLRVFF